MKPIITYILIPALALSLGSCKDFLSELPAKDVNQPVEKLEQLEGLLDNVDSGGTLYEANIAALYSTDDFGLTPEIYRTAAERGMGMLFPVENLYHFIFDVDNIIPQASDGLWANLYGAIYNYNLILENVDKVEGDAQRKKLVKAEAHFMRAYEMWLLANVYCLPWCEANLGEPGLPRRFTTDMEEDFTRMTIADTYKAIEKDLEDALAVMTELDGQPGFSLDTPGNRWRVSIAAINAFLSRYHLHKGDYAKAAEAAKYALDHKGAAALIDYNTIGTIPASPVISWSATTTWPGSRLVNLEEFFFARYMYNGFATFFTSRALVDLYDKQYDLRYKKMHWNAALLYFPGAPVEMPCLRMYYNGMALTSGPTVQEVMLNRAEALLRQSTPDVSGALALVNELRDYRFDPSGGDYSMTASGAQDALRQVLEERRRELALTARWYDIRRFAVNGDLGDDVTVTHQFFEIENGAVDMDSPKTYTLAPGSRRYAVPLNIANIQGSQGRIEQNRY